MEKFRTGFMILNFYLKYFFRRLFFSKGIKYRGKKFRSKADCTAVFKCDKKSKLILRTLTARSYSYLCAIAGGTLETGENNFIGLNCNIGARQSIKIGNNCSFGPNTVVLDHDHVFGRAKAKGKDFLCGDIVIGNNCWIGANVVILRDTEIGDNCVIGAGCIVKGKIPANSLVKSSRTLEIEPITK